MQTCPPEIERAMKKSFYLDLSKCCLWVLLAPFRHHADDFFTHLVPSISHFLAVHPASFPLHSILTPSGLPPKMKHTRQDTSVTAIGALGR